MAAQTPIGPGFTIREATNADGDAVRSVVTLVLEEYGLTSDPSDTDSDLADIETNYLAAGGVFEVIESGGRVVGTWGLYPQNRDVCELRKMYLLPEVRGQGLGQEVLVRAIEHARTRGFWRVELETAEVLREAIGLYRKFGFRPVTSEQLSSRCDQAYALDLRDA
jgi:putative acetyltransferase